MSQYVYYLGRKYAVVYWLKMLQYVYVFDRKYSVVITCSAGRKVFDSIQNIETLEEGVYDEQPLRGFPSG